MLIDSVSNLCSGYNLPSSTLALGCAFNDSRQIKNLNFSSRVLQNARDGSQSGERVGSNFALGLGDLGEKGRFANRGEADKCYTCITTFAYIKARATTRSSARSRF